MVFYPSVYFGATDIRIWESFESRLLVCARMQQKLIHLHAQLLYNSLYRPSYRVLTSVLALGKSRSGSR